MPSIKGLLRDIFNWRQLNFKVVRNYITIDCHNRSKELSYIKRNVVSRCVPTVQKWHQTVHAHAPPHPPLGIELSLLHYFSIPGDSYLHGFGFGISLEMITFRLFPSFHLVSCLDLARNYPGNNNFRTTPIILHGFHVIPIVSISFLLFPCDGNDGVTSIWVNSYSKVMWPPILANQ